MLRVQRTAGNHAAATVARRTLQRLDDEELDAIRADKTQKKELERIQKLYSDNFEKGDHRNYHGAETWHYWVEQATSLADLDKRITNLIKAAADFKARAPAPGTQPSQPTASGGSSPSISNPVPSSLPPSPSSAAPAPQKKKKTKMVPFDPSAVPASSPGPWGSGMNPPAASSPTYRPPPLPSVVDARNADVTGLIKHQPAGAVRALGQYWMTDDTIYFPLTVTEAPTTPPGLQQQIQRVWYLEIHYHPVPTTKNYLHVKMRAGTSAQNVLPRNNWLVDRNVFQAAVADWNTQKPDKKSSHAW